MSDDYVPLSRRSSAQLRAEAQNYRRMAATARMADTENSLLKLAIRFDALAELREHEASESGSRAE
jgi:hypothetical protein